MNCSKSNRLCVSLGRSGNAPIYTRLCGKNGRLKNMKLVIAEKPSVAQSLAAVIGATARKDGYLEGNGCLLYTSPKPNGNTRPLGIPCIWDRLVQQCIKQVMEPICEARFSNNRYGFRPNRSVENAIAATYRLSLIHIFSKVKYLGYTFYRYKGKCRFRVHQKSAVKMRNKSESLRIGTKALAMQNEKGNTGSMCEAGWNTLDLQI